LNETLGNYRRENPEEELNNFNLQSAAEAWIKTAKPRLAVAAFKSTEIYQFNPDVFLS
jgi:hypothetical protein